MYRKSATRLRLVSVPSGFLVPTGAARDLRNYLQAIRSYQAYVGTPHLSFERHLQNVISGGGRRPDRREQAT